MRYRRLAVVVAAVVVAAFGLVAPAPVAVAAPAAAGDSCDTNSRDSQIPPTAELRCINKRMLSTRGRIKPGFGCLWNRPQGFTYVRRQCGGNGGGIEYIGQARAIAELSKREGVAYGRVSANVQWEVTLGRTRADILYYDRFNTTAVDVIETKLTSNKDFADWPKQLGGYIAKLQAMQMANIVPGTELNRWGPYHDEFQVDDTRVACGGNGTLVRSFLATSPVPGLLQIEEVVPSRVCSNNRYQDHIENLPAADEETDDDVVVPHRRPPNVFGDPHMITIDGLHYTFQAVGEFTLATSQTYDLDIQARFAAHVMSLSDDPVIPTYSTIDRVAMWVNEHIVELTMDGMLLNGSPYPLARGGILELGNNSRVLRSSTGPDVYEVHWDGKGGPILAWQATQYWPQAGLFVPQSPDNDLQGLLGNADGDPLNDLRLPDGTQLPPDPPSTTLYGSYASSWRVTDETSLFTYAPGESTATFTDTSYPHGVPVTVDRLTPEQIELASEVCASRGVPAGPQFNDCVVDVTGTANNDFAAMAAEATQVAVDPTAARVTPDGDLTADFEATSLPANIRPARLTSDEATTTFAGPFSGTGKYRAYVQSLPRHDTGTVTFDLVALGDWRADADTETVMVEVNRRPIGSFNATVTPARTGVLANGVPFAVYPVRMAFNDSAGQLEVLVRAAGVDGLAGQGFGIDNLALHLTVVPPQVFPVSLPASIADGVPAAGAGNLETSAAQDEFRFDVPDGRSIYVELASCSMLRWRLLDAAGNQVSAGPCATARQVQNLPAGTYRLAVSSLDGATGTYIAQVYLVPSPDAFDTTLPLTIADGVPGPGAGNLETKASRDEYRFNVASGQSVYVDVQSCTGSGYITWTLTDAAGVPVGLANCTDREIANLAGGEYRLTVTSPNGYLGPYGLQIFVTPAPDVFTASLPLSVSNGVPGPGAGNLETKASRDEYRFTVPDGQSLFIDAVTCPSSAYLEWRLENDASTTVASAKTCSDRQVDGLPGGTYRLVVTPQSEHTGTYAIQVYAVPEPQIFDMALPVMVSDGVPGPGAGNLETKASRDEYRFTVADGQSLYVDATTCPGYGYLIWNLVDAAGTTVAAASTCSDRQLTSLPAGVYRLVVAPQSEHIGPYSMQVFVVPPPDVFDVSIPVTISDGAPGPGAGNLETKASRDEYRFSLQAGQSLTVDVQACPSFGYLSWSLVDATGTAVAAGACADRQVSSLPAGAYRLVVTPQSEHTGTYALQLRIA